MKSSSLTHLVWGLAMVVAFMAGRSMTPHSPPAAPVVPPAATIIAMEPATKNPAPKNDAPKTAEAPASAPTTETPTPAVLDREQARTRTYELLAEPSHFERMHALCELLAGLSKDNWHEVVDAFVRQTTKTGRRHDEEWFLMLEHVGEVVGADAFGPNAPQGEYDKQAAFSGFATHDSKGATEWLNAQPPAVQQNLMGRLISGVAQSDPQQAFTLACAQPLPVALAAIEEIMASIIQHGGIFAAEEMFDSIKGNADVPRPVKEQVFLEMARRKSFATGVENQPADALEWFDRYLGPDSVAGPDAAQEIVGRAAKGDGGER